MKKNGINKAEKDFSPLEITIEKEVSDELLKQIGKSQTPIGQIPIGRNPLTELIGKSFKDERASNNSQDQQLIENACSSIDEYGTIENDLSCDECKLILALQIILTEQTESVKRKIEICRESEKKRNERINKITDRTNAIKEDETTLLNGETIFENIQVNPNFEGINFTNLSNSTKEAIKETFEYGETRGKIITTRARLLYLMGKGRNFSGNRLDWIDDKLNKFKLMSFIRAEKNPFEGFTLNQKFIIKNYDKFVSVEKAKTTVIYKIELSELFTTKEATDFLLLPYNYCEIIGAIKEKPFLLLFRWLLVELSENRRDEKGIKINKFTPISKRGDIMLIKQPLENTTNTKGTKENERGLFSILFTVNELRKRGKPAAKKNIENWLVTLRDFKFIKNFVFQSDYLLVWVNRIKSKNIAE